LSRVRAPSAAPLITEGQMASSLELPRRLVCSQFYKNPWIAIRSIFSGDRINSQLSFLFDQFAQRGILHLDDLVGLTPHQIFQDYNISFANKRFFFNKIEFYGVILDCNPAPLPTPPSSNRKGQVILLEHKM
jgi:hypothetical protein